MLQDIQREIIRFAIDLGIDSVNTYGGYKRDLIVKMMTKNKANVLDIRKHSLEAGAKEVIIKEKLDTAQYEIFCVTANDGVYSLR